MNMALFMFAFWALSVVGLIIMAAGNRKVGGVLAIIGSILFVPLGLIAMFGVRSVMNSEQDESLDERRRLASTTTDLGSP
ncbi:MAG: hypothetical protein LBE22_00005 [Azoarcus sp.]|nr:hypothetical protein [Azoarcus sp.]